MRIPYPLVFAVFLALPFHTRARAQSRDRCDEALSSLATRVSEASGLSDDAQSDLLRRARLSALVPTLRVGVRRGLGQGLSGAYVDDTQSSSRLTYDASLAFDVSVSFPLERLVFAPEETSLLRNNDSRARERDALIAAAFALYADWLGRDPAQDAFARAQLFARLDAMTRGGFAPIARLPCAPSPRARDDD